MEDHGKVKSGALEENLGPNLLSQGKDVLSHQQGRLFSPVSFLQSPDNIEVKAQQQP